jgi:hypothetical protein
MPTVSDARSTAPAVTAVGEPEEAPLSACNDNPLAGLSRTGR